jgi:hypothetical protein
LGKTDILVASVGIFALVFPAASLIAAKLLLWQW